MKRRAHMMTARDSHKHCSRHHSMPRSCCEWRSLLLRSPLCSRPLLRSPWVPRRKKVYTVLRSPHVNKDAREQFEVCPAAPFAAPGSPRQRRHRCAGAPRVVPPGRLRQLCAARNVGACLACVRRQVGTCGGGPHHTASCALASLQVRLHQRLIDIKDLSSQTVDKLMSLDLPAGVDVEVGAAGVQQRAAAAHIQCACWKRRAVGRLLRDSNPTPDVPFGAPAVAAAAALSGLHCPCLLLPAGEALKQQQLSALPFQHSEGAAALCPPSLTLLGAVPGLATVVRSMTRAGSCRPLAYGLCPRPLSPPHHLLSSHFLGAPLPAHASLSLALL